MATQWCHGAPGIALSRLRGYELYGDETARAEAVAGIATTRKMVTTDLSTRRANYSLCHGLAGSAEVLLHAEEILGSGWAHDRALVIRFAEDGEERFAGPDQSWPCEVDEGVTPNLMVGLAGITSTLRVYDPTVPSASLLRPESFSGITDELNRGVNEQRRDRPIPPRKQRAWRSERASHGRQLPSRGAAESPEY